MQNDMDKTQFFCEYYKQWIEIYKRGAIREATMAKYLMTQKWLEKLIPELKVEELTRTAYQQQDQTSASGRNAKKPVTPDNS